SSSMPTAERCWQSSRTWEAPTKSGSTTATATTSSPAATQHAGRGPDPSFSGSLIQRDSDWISQLFSRPLLGLGLHAGPIRLLPIRALTKFMCRFLRAAVAATGIFAELRQPKSARQVPARAALPFSQQQTRTI